jgi:hypothetical protein
MITNSLKCKDRLHHFDGFVERPDEELNSQNADVMWGRGTHNPLSTLLLQHGWPGSSHGTCTREPADLPGIRDGSKTSESCNR